MSEDRRAQDARRTVEEERIPVVEERVEIGTRVRETGKVRVDTRVVTDTETLRETLSSQEVEVERVPVGREVDAVPEVRTEDGVTIIPVVDEELVVSRRLVLREEVHVRALTRSEDVEVPVELRRTEVDVNRQKS